MNNGITRLAAAAGGLTLMLLAGCSSTSPEPTASMTAEPSPTASTTSAPIGAETVLAITTTATAPEGAQLDLAVHVQRSLPADDPAASEMRTLLTKACGPDFITEEKLDSEAWGLVRVDVTATAAGSAKWPVDSSVSLVTAPRGEAAAAATTSSGPPLATPTDPSGELGPCLVPSTVAEAGESHFVLGIRYDFSSPDAQGVFWNGFRYGLSTTVFGENTGVELSGCHIVKTPLGEELVAPEVGYSETDEADECSAGIPGSSA